MTSKEKMTWKRAALLLKEGALGVIPTDTLYGICASALNKKAITQVYKLKKRKLGKPVIILISSFKDLSKFGIHLNSWQKKILEKIWPGRISVILPCHGSTLAFRLPKNRELLKIVEISGPLIAPSANWEGSKPAKNINQAKKYFGENVFYYNKGNLSNKASTLIDLTQKTKRIKILRIGADYNKIKKIFDNIN